MYRNLISEQLSRSCKIKLDIGIVLDGSGSIPLNYFESYKNFIVRLIAFFGVSDSASRVGLVSFSDNAKLIFRLGQLIAYSQFRRELANLRQVGGSSRLDLGMKVASTMFDSKNGGRTGIAKVLFVVTDGIKSNIGSRSPLEYAKLLRDQGVLIIAISAGQKIDFTVLRGLAGDETRTFIAPMRDNLESESFIRAVSNTACKYACKYNEFSSFF